MSEPGIRYIEPPEPDDRLIAIELEGHFSVDDMKSFLDHLEKVNADGKKARVFEDIRGFDGFDFAVVTEKFKSMGKILKGIEKVAIVGDKRWIELYIKAVDPVTKASMKHFQPEERDEAFAWLRE